MSDTSSHSGSGTSSDGQSPSTDQLAFSEGSKSEEAERRSPELKQAQTKAKYYERQESEPDVQSKEDEHSHHAQNKMKGHLNKAYQDLFNSAIKEASRYTQENSEPLSSSQIGASFWTSAEKEVLFRSVARVGPDNLLALARAIGTKTEPEVSYYLRLLQGRVLHDNPPLALSSALPSVEFPAALEVGEHCDNALNLAASALDRHVLREGIDLEELEFGDYWLINDSTAAELERDFQQSSNAAFKGEDDAVPSANDKPSDIEGEGAKYAHQEKQLAKRPNSGAFSKSALLVDSANLLAPEAFLELSRRLFMNSATDPTLNWSSVDPPDPASPTPAIFRSAFDEFHDLATIHSRRVVQASLFQANSRLRAKDDSRSERVVTENDVRTALDLMNQRPVWKIYWATIARRCGIDVYSEAEKFRDGREGTKNGVKLSWDEVEAELGVTPRPPDHSFTGNRHNEPEIPSDQRSSRKELHSSLETLDKDHGEDEVSDEEQSDVESESKDDYKVPRKRRRSSSLGEGNESEDEEERFLDSIDGEDSRQEERRLLEMLGHEHSLNSKLETQDPPRSPRRSSANRQDRSDFWNWRKHVKYEAEWEQHQMTGNE